MRFTLSGFSQESLFIQPKRIKMKTTLLFPAAAALLCLITVLPVLAQDNPDAPCTGSCSFCFCASDVTCNSSDCGNPGGCTFSNVFSVPCTSTYRLVSKVICTGASRCRDCSVCVDVFLASDLTHSLGECHNSDCLWGGGCAYGCSVCLHPNTDYVMRVCLIPCPTHGCGECAQDCKGYGCVYQNVIYECVPL
jgi:hypothetical protein